MKSLMVCLIGLLVSAQAGLASLPVISGQVRLSDGSPVAGAQVVLFDLADLRRGIVAHATTDEAGQFALATLGTSLPQGFALGQNYPNPFNPSTIIPYQLAATSQVRLEVFNTLGQRMATLVNGNQEAGSYRAQWDGTDAAGRAAAAGLYFYRLTVEGAQQTGRMVLVDGQAGVPMGGGSVEILPMAVGPSSAYGLVVLGPGMVTYVDSDFVVAPGMEQVDIEVEAGQNVRMKVVQSGILGDMDNNGQVDMADGLLVAMYSADPSTSMPNNVDIARGDVNCDHRTDWIDAWLIVTYSINPLDPAVQSLQIGQSGGCAEEDIPGGGHTAATMMYWTDYRTDTIYRSNLDGSNVEPLVTGEEYPRGIALDVSGGKIYWTGWGVYRSNLDGSNVEPLGTGTDAEGIALDVAGGKIYWTDQGTILWVRFIGRIWTGRMSNPSALEGHIQEASRWMWLAARYTGRAGEFIGRIWTGRMSNPSSLDWMSHSASRWMCPAARYTGRTGRIGGTILWVRFIGRIWTGRMSNPSSLDWMSHSASHWMCPAARYTGRTVVRVWFIGRTWTGRMSKPSALERYLQKTSRWMWLAARYTGRAGEFIGRTWTGRMSKPSSSHWMCQGTSSWMWLAARCTGRTLMCSGGFIGRIWTGRISKFSSPGLDEPAFIAGFIALDVSGGKMYWMALTGWDGWGDDSVGLVYRSNLDGSNVEPLVTGLYWPGGIALDVSGGKMYWTDRGDDSVGLVYRSNLDGSNVEPLVTGTDEPGGHRVGCGWRQDVPGRTLVRVWFIGRIWTGRMSKPSSLERIGH